MSRPRRPQTAAVAATLKAMRGAGQLADVDAALVALVSGLAGAVDDDPSNASLWREFRAALIALREAGVADGGADEEAELLQLVRPSLRNG